MFRGGQFHSDMKTKGNQKKEKWENGTEGIEKQEIVSDVSRKKG